MKNKFTHYIVTFILFILVLFTCHHVIYSQTSGNTNGGLTFNARQLNVNHKSLVFLQDKVGINILEPKAKLHILGEDPFNLEIPINNRVPLLAISEALIIEDQFNNNHTKLFINEYGQLYINNDYYYLPQTPQLDGSDHTWPFWIGSSYNQTVHASIRDQLFVVGDFSVNLNDETTKTVDELTADNNNISINGKNGNIVTKGRFYHDNLVFNYTMKASDVDLLAGGSIRPFMQNHDNKMKVIEAYAGCYYGSSCDESGKRTIFFTPVTGYYFIGYSIGLTAQWKTDREETFFSVGLLKNAAREIFDYGHKDAPGVEKRDASIGTVIPDNSSRLTTTQDNIFILDKTKISPIGNILTEKHSFNFTNMGIYELNVSDLVWLDFIENNITSTAAEPFKLENSEFYVFYLGTDPTKLGNFIPTLP